MTETRLIQVGGHRARLDGESETFWAKVDAEDYERLARYKWSPLGLRGGRRIAVRRERQPGGSYRMVSMHREVTGLPPGSRGDSGSALVVDHRNGDTMDNRKENLRVCTHLQNMQNRPKGIHRRKGQRTSRFRGVVHDPKYRLPWSVTLRFPTEEEAGQARLAWELQYMPYANPYHN